MSPARLTAAVLLVTAGCSVAPPPATDPGARPAGLSRGGIERYHALDDIVLRDGDTRWILTPSSILEIDGGYLSFQFDADDGLAGRIQAATQDAERVWIGTERGIQALEKDLHALRDHVVEPGLDCRFLAPLDGGRPGDPLSQARDVVALTAMGAILLDGLTQAYEIYPLDTLDLREVTDVAVFNDFLWVATRRGLIRFSLNWKNWDDSFGNRALRRAPIVRFETAVETFAGQFAGYSFYAIGPSAVFQYRETFDSWDRVSF